MDDFNAVLSTACFLLGKIRTRTTFQIILETYMPRILELLWHRPMTIELLPTLLQVNL
jgi:hypothetical protein